MNHCIYSYIKTPFARKENTQMNINMMSVSRTGAMLTSSWSIDVHTSLTHMKVACLPFFHYSSGTKTFSDKLMQQYKARCMSLPG